jgi:outer membrane protein OmpA-like peptidoglycan-associated protein
MALSERRAKTVVAYLVRQGIPKKRLKVRFFGETKPLDSNDTEEGREKNRRVEFKILKL